MAELFVAIIVAVVTATPPTLAVALAVWVQSKKLHGIHTLVNDQMTIEKAARLYDLRAQRIVLTRLLGDEASESDEAMLRDMDQQIKALAKEIRERNKAAASMKEGEAG